MGLGRRGRREAVGLVFGTTTLVQILPVKGVSDGKRTQKREPDIPPKQLDIQPEPRPQEIPQDKDMPEKEFRQCSFSF